MHEHIHIALYQRAPLLRLRRPPPRDHLVGYFCGSNHCHCGSQPRYLPRQQQPEDHHHRDHLVVAHALAEEVGAATEGEPPQPEAPESGVA